MIFSLVEFMTLDQETNAFNTILKAMNPSVKIQVTSVMKNVLHAVLQAQDKYKLILLVGPTMVGKTTTLLRLLKKLQKLGRPVLALNLNNLINNVENINVDEYSVFLMDLHELHSQLDEHFVIDKFVNACCMKHKIFIAAASSISECLIDLGHRKASKMYSTFRTMFDPYLMEPLSAQQANELVKDVHGSITPDMVQYVLEESCCIPGLINMRTSSKGCFSSQLIGETNREFTLVATAINSTGTQLDNLFLLTAWKHDLPYTLYDNFTEGSIQMATLVRCHVLYIRGGEKLGLLF